MANISRMKRFLLPVVTLLVLPASISLAPRNAEAAAAGVELACKNIPRLLQAYLYNHIHVKKLTDEIKERTIENYIKNLDPSKTLFLKGEREKMKADLIGLFDRMQRNDCSALNKAQKLYVERSKDIEQFVSQTVGKKEYKIDESVVLVTDSKQKDSPATVEERNATLTKWIHFQMSNLVSGGESLEDAKKRLIHRYELRSKRAQETKEEDLYYGVLGSFSLALDPHSSYFSPDALEDFKISMQLSLEGIGVLLSPEDGYTIVEEIIPGGAAAREGSLQPKDKIIAVTDMKKPDSKPVNIIDMELRDVVKLIRGEKDSKVKLTVLREGETTQRLEVVIQRDKIDLQEQAAKIRYETKKLDGKDFKLGVLELPSFYGGGDGERSSYEDMKRLLAEANKNKVDGMLLDLSKNGGGLLSEAVKISGLFIQKGGVVAVQDSNKDLQILEDTDEAVQYTGPLVVLTSRLSASASEILAGALKDYKRAVIIGDGHTFGKGSVQAVLTLPPGFGALKVTTSMYYRPSGKSTQMIGVNSDIVVPTAFALDDIGEKALDHALPQQLISPFLEGKNLKRDAASAMLPWPEVSGNLVSVLSERSRKRIDGNKEFEEVLKSLEEAKKNKGVVKLADLKKEDATAKAEADKAKKKKKKKGDEEVTAQHKEALNILADFVSLERKQIAKIVNASNKTAQ